MESFELLAVADLIKSATAPYLRLSRIDESIITPMKRVRDHLSLTTCHVKFLILSQKSWVMGFKSFPDCIFAVATPHSDLDSWPRSLLFQNSRSP